MLGTIDFPNVASSLSFQCCITKVHATIIVSSSLVTTHGSQNLMDLLLPFKCIIREFVDKFNNLLGLSSMNVTLSMATIISSNASIVHLPLLVIIGTLLTCGDLFQFSYVWCKLRGQFFFVQCWLIEHVASSFMRHIQVHGGPTLLGPCFHKWGTCVKWPH